ncbi:MAG: hypothetical protein ACI80V_000870 [Rhodothermales bacterium]|jgi:hypothetical protein
MPEPGLTQPSQGPIESSGPSRSLGFLAPLRQASAAVVRTCERTAVIGWVAGAVIVGVVLFWTWPLSATAAGFVGFLGALLALPGSIVFLLGRALASVSRLPEALVGQATSGSDLSLQIGGGPVRSAWKIGRYLLSVRSRLWAMRDELATAGALVRLTSPVVLIVVLGAVLAVGVLVPVAVLVLLTALLF